MSRNSKTPKAERWGVRKGPAHCPTGERSGAAFPILRHLKLGMPPALLLDKTAGICCNNNNVLETELERIHLVASVVIQEVEKHLL